MEKIGKTKKSKILSMVEDELLGLSKVMDVSESIKELNKLKEKYGQKRKTTKVRNRLAEKVF